MRLLGNFAGLLEPSLLSAGCSQSFSRETFYRAYPHVCAQCLGDWAWPLLGRGDWGQVPHPKAASCRDRRQALCKSHPDWPNSTQANLSHKGAAPRQKQGAGREILHGADCSHLPAGQLVPFSFQTAAWHWTPFISRLVWVSSSYCQRSDWHMCECL